MKRFLGCLLLAFGLFSACSTPVAGAEATGQSTDAVLDVMPDMQQRFEAIDELIEKKEWVRVLDGLEEIAEQAGGAVWSRDGQVYTTVKRYVGHRLVSLPPDALALYRMRVDGQALQLWRRGVSDRDVGLLDELVDKFPASSHTEAALDAAINLLIDTGRYAEAALRIERLLARPAAAAPQANAPSRAMALAKLGFCHAKRGNPEAVRAIEGRLKNSGAQGRATLGNGQDVSTFLRDILEQGVGEPPLKVAAFWPAPGGDETHRRPMHNAGLDLSRRWAVKMGDEEAEDKPGIKVSPWPVVGQDGSIYIHTGTSLYAFDQKTGRRLWATRPLPIEEKPVDRRRQMFGSWSRWAGAASVSLGGGLVYATEIMGIGPKSNSSTRVVLKLSAFDARNGQRLWSFDQTLEEGGFDGEAMFPWAPHYVDGRLIGTVIHYGQAFLVALDAGTGKLLWRVYLAKDLLAESDIHHRNFLRTQKSEAVVISDGVAFAATGMGAVAAVEVSSGRLLWLATYPRKAIHLVEYQRAWGIQTIYPMEKSWGGGFPVVEHGRLYVAPWDASELLAFDRFTGHILRRIPLDKFTDLAGVRDHVAFLVGQQTAAVDLRSGKRLWEVPTPFEVQGMPILTESALLIPTRGAICSITLAKPVVRLMKPLAGADDRLPTGNLVSLNGWVIAANADRISAYVPYETSLAHLTQLVEKKPEAIGALLDRAELFSLRAATLPDLPGRRAMLHRTLKDLLLAERRLGEQDPADAALSERLKQAMFEARLTLSEVEPNKAVAHVDGAKPYLFSEQKKIRWHLARGDALAAEERHRDALEAYLAITTDMGGKRLVDEQSEVAVEVLAQSRIGDLVARHGPEVYAVIDAALKPDYEKMVQAQDIDGLLKLQRRHPHSGLADNCLYETARILSAEASEPMRAQGLLRGLIRDYPRSKVLGEAHALLLRNYEASRQVMHGKALLRDLLQRHSKVTVPWEGQNRGGAEWAAAMLKRPEYATRLAAERPMPVPDGLLKRSWLSGKGAEILAHWVSDETGYDRGIALAVGFSGTKDSPRSNFARSSYVRAFSTATGDTLWQADLQLDWSWDGIEDGRSEWNQQRNYYLALCSGDVVAMGSPNEIVALDWLTGARRWSHRWERPQGDSTFRWYDRLRLAPGIQGVMNQRPVFAAGAGRIFYLLPDGILVCLHAANGQELWRATAGTFANGPIGLFDHMVVVAGLGPAEIYAFDIEDGQRLYRKPLPGFAPGHPIFDRAGNRLLISSDGSLVCYEMSEFRPIWEVKGLGPEGVPSQWTIRMLPNGNILLMYDRSASPVAIEQKRDQQLVVLDGATGERKWTYNASRRTQKGNDTEFFVVDDSPMLTRNRILIPMTESITKGTGRRQTRIRNHVDYIVDMATGTKVGEHRINARPVPRRNLRVVGWSKCVAATVAADQLIRMMGHSDGRQIRNRLYVTHITTGQEVLVDELADLKRLVNSVLGRVNAIAIHTTPDGKVLAPVGTGIRCYRAVPEAKTESPVVP